jgi:hypothetical protein
VYLFAENCILYIRAQARHLLCPSSRDIQFSAVDVLYVSRLTLSAKPSGDRHESGRLSSSSRFDSE